MQRDTRQLNVLQAIGTGTSRAARVAIANDRGGTSFTLFASLPLPRQSGLHLLIESNPWSRAQYPESEAVSDIPFVSVGTAVDHARCSRWCGVSPSGAWAFPPLGSHQRSPGTHVAQIDLAPTRHERSLLGQTKDNPRLQRRWLGRQNQARWSKRYRRNHIIVASWFRFCLLHCRLHSW